jgi:hypothetical protein
LVVDMAETTAEGFVASSTNRSAVQLQATEVCGVTHQLQEVKQAGLQDTAMKRIAATRPCIKMQHQRYCWVAVSYSTVLFRPHYLRRTVLSLFRPLLMAGVHAASVSAHTLSR